MIETTGQSIHGFWKNCEFSGAAAVEVKTDSVEGQGTEENRESDWKSDRKKYDGGFRYSTTFRSSL